MDYSDMMSKADVFSSYAAEEGVKQHNHEMNLAWQFVTSTNVSVFLTGKAGTGKTTFLRTLKERAPKRMVVLAPTGVAAINAQGQTIHSFFQLPFGPIVPGMQQGEKKGHYKMGKEKKNLIKTLDLLVIDEISMVRCDVLDAGNHEYGTDQKDLNMMGHTNVKILISTDCYLFNIGGITASVLALCNGLRRLGQGSCRTGVGAKHPVGLGRSCKCAKSSHPT